MNRNEIFNSIDAWTDWANNSQDGKYDIALFKIWIHFERFLADRFIVYALKREDENMPELKLTFSDEEHLNAFLINGNKKYIDYLPQIERLSKHIFVVDPFDLAIFSDSENNRIYNELIAIRNYVAHESGEAKSKLIKLVFSGNESRFKEPDVFLKERRKNMGKTNYSHYIDAIRNMVNIIEDFNDYI